MFLTHVFVKLPIRDKIASAFSVVLLLVAVLGFTAARQLANLDRSVDTIAKKVLVSTSELGDMREQLLRFRLSVARYIAAGDVNSAFDTATNAALAQPGQ